MAIPKIVVLGAGVAGLRIAKKLKKELRPGEADLLLVDQNDYHQLLYRLHKVCNYEYEEKDIVIPLQRLTKGITFKKATVETITLESDAIKTENGEIPYDILIVAMGSHPAYFNIEGIRENSLTLGNYDDAKEIRHRLFDLFKKAEQENTPPNIIVGGAGFTGIELAGELCDCLEKLYNQYSIQKPEKLFSIVEALPTILPGWDEKLIETGMEFLEKKKIELILNNPIVKVGEKEIILKDGTTLNPDLFIWTGGVEGDPACGKKFEIKSRRIIVNKTLQYFNFDVFVAGDLACTLNQEGKPMPPNAHIAMMQADIVVNNIISMLRNKPFKHYKYEHAGEIVTFGNTYAEGEVFGIRLWGLPAKMMKQFIHLWYLYSIGGFSLLLEYW